MQVFPLIIGATLAFTAGVMLGALWPLTVKLIFFLLIGTGLCVAIVASVLTSDESGEIIRTFAIYFSALSIMMTLGWVRYSISQPRFSENHLRDFLSKSREQVRVIEGAVVDQPQVFADKVRLRIDPQKVWLSTETVDPNRIDGGDLWLQVKPSYETRIPYEQLTKNAIYGDKLRITGTLTEPMEKSNPGGFSFKRYLHNKGVFGAIWFPQSVKRLEENRGNRLVAWALDLQTEMLRVIKKTVPYPQSAFLGGATLGLRGGLEYVLTPFGDSSNLVVNEFRAAGTIHVLAVSGLHVGVIAGSLWALFAGLRIPTTFYAPLVVGALVVFTIITGARPATIRASIMTALIVLSYAYLETDLKNSALLGIGFAAFLILLYRPHLIFEPAFTLSFMAVLCLALMTEPISRFLNRFRGLSFILFWVCLALTTVLCTWDWNWFFTWYIYGPYAMIWYGIFRYSMKVDRHTVIAGGFGFIDLPESVRSFISAQGAIQIGMMLPLSAYYFMRYPFAGLYANIVAIPLVGIIVPLGLFAGVIGLIPGIGAWLALFMNAANYITITAFLWFSHVAAMYFPYPSVRKFTLYQLVVCYGAIALFVWREKLVEWFRRIWYWLTDHVFKRLIVTPDRAMYLACVGLIVFVFGFSFLGETQPEKPTVTVLDVGYGNAIAIQTPNKNIQLNAGPRIWDWHNRANRADRLDNGKQTVAPFYLHQRIKTLDLVALQSVEPQYQGGLPFVTRDFSVESAVGPLPKHELTPFSKENYLNALDDGYYKKKTDKSWFQNDYIKGWERWWSVIQEQEIPYRMPKRGDILARDSFTANGRTQKIVLRCLHPGPNPNYEKYSAANRSMVLSLTLGNASILFPGDIRYDAQRDLINNISAKRLNHDLMIVPSSGTQSSSANKEFFDAVDPDHVVLSTGRIEIKGPLSKKLEKQAKKTWKKYSRWMNGNNIYRTDENGAVIIKSDGQTLSVEGFKT